MEYDFLMPNEQIIMEGAANKRQVGGLASKGGHLYLTNKRLIFKAHAFNLGSSFDEIPFSKIAFTGNTLNLLMPTPNMIRVNTTDGKNHGFIVTGKQKEQWKQKITEVVQEYKNNCENSQQTIPKNDEIVVATPVPDTNQSNVQEQKNIYSSEKVQETMDKLKESAESVSTAVKEKAKQAVQQSQEFIQSEQFQNAKNEAVRSTKNFIQRFFECNINSQEDFTRAELRRKRCLCVVFAMIAASIFLFSFYDEYYWFNGLWYSIMKFASFLSYMSRILLIPVCIIALIKYHYANKEIKRYQSENPDVQTHDMRMNKKAMAITLVICIICVPVVGKINDIAYQNDTHSESSEQVSPENKNAQKSNSAKKSDTKKDISTLQAQNPEYQFMLGTPLQIERKALVSGQWITTGYYEGNDETEAVYKQTYQDIVYCLRVGTFYADGSSDTVSLIIIDTPDVLKSWYDATRSGYGKRNQNIIMVNTIGKENYAWDFYDSHDYNIESKFQQPD